MGPMLKSIHRGPKRGVRTPWTPLDPPMVMLSFLRMFSRWCGKKFVLTTCVHVIHKIFPRGGGGIACLVLKKESPPNGFNGQFNSKYTDCWIIVSGELHRALDQTKSRLVVTVPSLVPVVKAVTKDNTHLKVSVCP